MQKIFFSFVNFYKNSFLLILGLVALFIYIFESNLIESMVLVGVSFVLGAYIYLVFYNIKPFKKKRFKKIKS